MTRKSANWVRWLALLPSALLATVIVKIGSEAVFRYVLIATLGLESWTSWVASGLAALLMGVAFVLTAGWVAPSAKTFVAGLALGIVVVWSAVQYLVSIGSGGPVTPVAIVAGAALGAALAYAALGRSRSWGFD
jgi:hypothetical protein